MPVYYFHFLFCVFFKFSLMQLFLFINFYILASFAISSMFYTYHILNSIFQVLSYRMAPVRLQSKFHWYKKKKTTESYKGMSVALVCCNG